MNSQDILTRIRQNERRMSKGQHRLAAYITEHYDKAVFLTAKQLGDAVGVSQSTTVRFAIMLGYEGYPEMQSALEESVKARLTGVQRIEVTNAHLDEKNLIAGVMQADIDNIQRTREELSEEELSAAVKAIKNAKTVYILGIRSAASLAMFLGNYLNLMREHVVQVSSNSISETFEQLVHIGEGDLLIGISFPRYSQRTVRAIRYAAEKGATTLAITDGDQSPLAEEASIKLYARSNMVSFVDTLVAPLSLINTLLVALTLEEEDSVKENLDELERIWTEYGVYKKEENNN